MICYVALLMVVYHSHLGGESDLGPLAASSCGGAEFRERFGGRGMALTGLCQVI